MKALLIIDIQNDFIPGGALAVPEGDTIIPYVNHLQNEFDLVVATQDWHPANHKSFASQHENKMPLQKIMLQDLEQVLWPDHCVQGTKGAEFHPSLDMNKVEAIFRKGMDPEIDSYSGFYDNGHKKSTGLAGYLRARSVGEVFVCGLAGDYCVFYTAKDALKEKFRTSVIQRATKPIDDKNFEKAKQEIIAMGGEIV